MTTRKIVPARRRQAFDGASDAYNELFKKLQKTIGKDMQVCNLRDLSSPSELKGFDSRNAETRKETRTRVRARLRSAIVYRAAQEGIDADRIFCGIADRENPDLVRIGIRS